MCVVKTLAMIFLAAFLILGSVADFFGFHPGVAGGFLLGLLAISSGVMMFVSIHEFVCMSGEK